MSREGAWLPPLANNAKGEPRKVGIELEFSGITHSEATDAVAAWADSRAQSSSLVEAVVAHKHLGEFEIEVDWRYLKRTAQEQQITEGSDNWVRFLREAARLVVPVEVVAPPVPAAALPELESLIEQLRQAGAEGTGESPLAAYGLHLNPEIPALSAESLLAYLQAFALLQWWLIEQHHVDVTRRLTPYVDAWPDDYLTLVLGYQGVPALDQMLLDYFDHNPTRNRSLDLWPLFAEYDRDKVEELMHEPLIKARPAFHYRLPNCSIDRPSWRLWDEWQRWLVVELLAADQTARRHLTDVFFSVKRPLLGVHKRHWLKTIDQWLALREDHG